MLDFPPYIFTDDVLRNAIWPIVATSSVVYRLRIVNNSNLKSFTHGFHPRNLLNCIMSHQKR